MLWLILALFINAQETVKEKRYVIKVTETEIYLDITAEDGVSVGQVFELFRPGIEMKHPVTGKVIYGEIPVGFIIIQKIGSNVSVAVPTKGLEITDVKVGDVIYLSKKVEKKEEVKKEFIRKDLGFTVDYCMYNSDDIFLRSELGFRYSHHREILYGLRFGMGGIYAFSIPEEYRYDESTNPEGYKRANFYYGYSEFLFGGEYFSVTFKFKIGLDPDGIGYGFDGGMIIGSEFKTYLLIGGMFEDYTGAMAHILFQTPVTSKLFLYGDAAVEWIPIPEIDPGFRMLVGTIIWTKDSTALKLFAGLGGRTSEVVYPSLGAGILWKF